MEILKIFDVCLDIQASVASRFTADFVSLAQTNQLWYPPQYIIHADQRSRGAQEFGCAACDLNEMCNGIKMS